VARSLRIAIASALLLAAGNAAALGLGQIEVKSQRSQPLLAEIPIISTTPGELEALQARLASPETFRRIGLAPPSGIAADLQFSLGSDARGRPVIRVTTLRPVDQPVLNFLIEVDWGQGRLVREYSALVDVPRTASAPLQPAIQAPVIAAPAVVQRPVQEPAPLPVPAPPAAVPPAEPAREPSAIPLPAPVPVATAPVPMPAPAATATPAQYGPVKPGETLGAIVRRLDLPGEFSLDQGLLALLRANPDAFLGDDINRLKRGAVLRVPGSSEIAAVSADEAALVVRQQMQQWRQARRPVLQPESAPVAASAPAVTRAATAPAATSATAPAATPSASRPAPAPAPQRTQARLEIVPPSAPGRTTATRSGMTAGGEGSMLQQELRQRDEDIAAKTAEIGELKERVAELERMRQQQQDLLSMKDSELASVQQRLAAARTAGATPDAAAAQPATSTQAEASPAAAAEPSAGVMPWIWGGLALLGLAMLAWLFSRRRKPAPAPRRSFDSDALAASLRAPVQETDDATAVVVDTPAGDAASAPVADAPAEPVVDAPSAAAPRGDAPAWHSTRWTQSAPPPAPAPAADAMPRFVPLQPQVEDAAEELAAEPPPEGGDHRLKLALAFLDIGDDESARQLLRELLHSTDPAARAEAARVLRDLG
jgi:pilus assembly protein FimV